MLTLLAAILFYVIFMWSVQKRRQLQTQAALAQKRRPNHRA